MKARYKLKKGGLVKYVDGGAVGSGVGAAAGSFLPIPIPGVGTKIGSIAGELVGNALTAKSRRRKLEEMQREEDLINKVGVDTGLQQFKKGGLVPMRNGLKVKGPKHEQGGVEIPQLGIEVEGGETIANLEGIPFVFSDTLKANKSETFADKHKRQERDGVGEQFTKDLAIAQERVKQPHGNTTLGDAGRLQGRKFRFGGPGIDPIKLSGAPTQLSDRQKEQRDQISGVTDINPIATPSLSADPTSSDPGGIFGGIFREGADGEESTFTKAAPYLGSAFNIGAGLLGANKAPKFKPIDRSAINTLQSTPTRLNVEPQLQEQRRALNTVLQNPSTSSNAALAALSQGLQNRSRILSQKENIETQRKIDKASRIAQVQQSADQFDAAGINAQRVNEQNARTANLGLIGRGIAQIGETKLTQQRDERLQQSNDFSIAASLQAVSPEVAEDFIASLPEEQQKRVRGIMSRQSSRLSSTGGN